MAKVAVDGEVGNLIPVKGGKMGDETAMKNGEMLKALAEMRIRIDESGGQNIRDERDKGDKRDKRDKGDKGDAFPHSCLF